MTTTEEPGAGRRAWPLETSCLVARILSFVGETHVAAARVSRCWRKAARCAEAWSVVTTRNVAQSPPLRVVAPHLWRCTLHLPGGAPPGAVTAFLRGLPERGVLLPLLRHLDCDSSVLPHLRRAARLARLAVTLVDDLPGLRRRGDPWWPRLSRLRELSLGEAETTTACGGPERRQLCMRALERELTERPPRRLTHLSLHEAPLAAGTLLPYAFLAGRRWPGLTHLCLHTVSPGRLPPLERYLPDLQEAVFLLPPSSSTTSSSSSVPPVAPAALHPPSEERRAVASPPSALCVSVLPAVSALRGECVSHPPRVVSPSHPHVECLLSTLPQAVNRVRVVVFCESTTTPAPAISRREHSRLLLAGRLANCRVEVVSAPHPPTTTTTNDDKCMWLWQR